MRKVNYETLIELLKSKGSKTYKELSDITGYHPKSLVRINSLLKNNDYKVAYENLNDKIMDDYLNGTYKTYRDFYNKTSYNISYSKLCNVLNSIKVEKEILIIRKRKRINKYYFDVVDYMNRVVLFSTESLKNDAKSFNIILFRLLNEFGAPKNIMFVNFFNNKPLDVLELLKKYDISLIDYSSLYRQALRKLSNNTICIKYRNVIVDKTDFYNFKKRKTIASNILQFNNIRYYINSHVNIERNNEVILYYDSKKSDVFILYNNTRYVLTPIKYLLPKTGNAKY